MTSVMVEVTDAGRLPGTLPANALLPLSFDPRDEYGDRLTTPVRSQPVRDRRCTAFAVASMMETWWCRHTGSVVGVPFLSINDLFTGSEQLRPTVARAAQGVMDETYPDGRVPPHPPEAHRWKLTWRSFLQTLDDRPLAMCRALVKDGPLAITLRIYDNFDRWVDPDGTRVYRPTPSSLPLLDAHAVCIVGFDQIQRVWIVKNSNATWGHHGFGRIAWRDREIEPEADVVGARRVIHPT